MKVNLEVKGKIVGITKVSEAKDQSAYKITLDSKVYFEVNEITDLGVLQKLVAIGDLGDKVKIKIERD